MRCCGRRGRVRKRRHRDRSVDDVPGDASSPHEGVLGSAWAEAARVGGHRLRLPRRQGDRPLRRRPERRGTGGVALAIEGMEGTDACIRRGGELGHGGVVVVKVSQAAAKTCASTCPPSDRARSRPWRRRGARARARGRSGRFCSTARRCSRAPIAPASPSSASARRASRSTRHDDRARRSLASATSAASMPRSTRRSRTSSSSRVVDIDPARAARPRARFRCRACPTSRESRRRSSIARAWRCPLRSIATIGAASPRGRHRRARRETHRRHAREARDLVRIAEQRGRILQVGHLERFNPAIRALAAHAHAAAVCRVSSPGAVRRARHRRGRGARSHDPRSRRDPQHDDEPGVRDRGGRGAGDHASPDIANARIRFADGAIANVTASRVSLKRERKLRIFQHDTYISLDYGEKRMQHLPPWRGTPGRARADRGRGADRRWRGRAR